MDYAVALFIYLISLVGVLVGIGSMIVFSKDKVMIRFSALTVTVFTATTYLSGTLLNAVN